MKYTPELISNSNVTFSIPIYQRLFEWDSDNIVTLLDDLYKSFADTEGCGDYYIGMLTSTTDNELVDGQQRFTVMMLLGSVLKRKDDHWNKFLFCPEPRLTFSARPSDNDYLLSMLNDETAKESGYVNRKMASGIKTIEEYLNALNEQECSKFAGYIFSHLCFFITELPDKYSPSDLNRYFERMNTSGKNLEQHEILKVKLLRNLPDNIGLYMKLWNLLSEVDTPLLRKRSTENEYEFEVRKKEAIKNGFQYLHEHGIINGLGNQETENLQTIISITASSTPPSADKKTEKEDHCALTFPYLLLQTLYWKLDGKISDRIDDFFKPSNLLDTFAKYLPYDGENVNSIEIIDFMEKLLKCRLALDICFIRNTDYGYSLDMNLPEGNDSLQELLMLESMLYVSSSNYTHYRWFGWLMNYIQKCCCVPAAQDLLEELKRCDDNEHSTLPRYEDLSYGEIRYWFWRLDYYIWKNRKELFKDDVNALTVAENYVFKRNRSIEHIAPQTPQTESSLKWDESKTDQELRDSFGNLVMISQGLNSALSNESYEVKTAHVQSFCNGSKTGSIESLKLLLVHKKYKCWTKETIVEHGREMYELLKKSFV